MSEDQIPLFEDQSDPPPDLFPGEFLQAATQGPKLVSVYIDGLKGFDEIEVALGPLTVLTGPNNSGKSTILQAVALAFECFRRCLDLDRWKLRETGRAVTEFNFLPVNEPKDLWYRRIWKPTAREERYVRVGLQFENEFRLVFRIRFLFGLLNISLESAQPEPDEQFLRALLSSSPVLLPASPGPSAHEDYVTLAHVHKMLSIREPSRVLRNVLMRLQDDENADSRRFVDETMRRYFNIELEQITFDENRDLEIRAPLREQDYAIDIVSCGSGLNQILQLAAIIAWRKPGLVLLDEPDSHLHSSVQAQLFDFLTNLVERYGVQVILATHSRDLISQAPLESIVPVDRSRSRLEPLQSLDHLLLEYQRYGQVSNLDLALLYQTKRCLFVEGPTDTRMLPRIAERLGISLFVGRSQMVPFEFGGVDKLKFLPELVRLFERLIGAKLDWGVVRDGDATVPAVRGKIAEVAAGLGIPKFHQWERYSIENYLLDAELLHEAIVARRPELEGPCSPEVVNEMLLEAVTEAEGRASGAIITKAQQAFRDHQLSDRPQEDGATAATNFMRDIVTLETKIRAYPGKRIFGGFVQRLQNRFGLNLRLDDVIAVLSPANAPPELLEVLGRLATPSEQAAATPSAAEEGS